MKINFINEFAEIHLSNFWVEYLVVCSAIWIMLVFQLLTTVSTNKRCTLLFHVAHYGNDIMHRQLNVDDNWSIIRVGVEPTTFRTGAAKVTRSLTHLTKVAIRQPKHRPDTNCFIIFTKPVQLTRRIVARQPSVAR